MADQEEQPASTPPAPAPVPEPPPTDQSWLQIENVRKSQPVDVETRQRSGD
jgi:hypothetical protein